jgi:hypothetical protein
MQAAHKISGDQECIIEKLFYKDTMSFIKAEKEEVEQSGMQIAQQFLAKLEIMQKRGEYKDVVPKFIQGVNKLLNEQPPLRDNVLKKTIQELHTDLAELIKVK